MDPITIGLLIGAATGALKGANDQDTEARQRKAAAETMRWSPWTHMQAGAIKPADMVGSTMQGGLSGAMMGQQFGGGAAAAADNPVYSDAGTTSLQGDGALGSAQNQAIRTNYDYSNPQGSGFGAYPGAGAGAGARPAYPWGQLR